LIELIIPQSNNLKHATIEPLIIPQEKLDELKTVLANPKLADVRKSFMMSRISGHCLVCGNLPSHIAKYRMNGITKIEKYCNECLERMQT
jgi:hypothetical protein